jgi:hypothetical protein
MEAENPAAVLNCGPVIFIYLFAPLAVDDHARFRTSISAWQIHLVVEDFGLFADLSRVGKWALVLKFWLGAVAVDPAPANGAAFHIGFARSFNFALGSVAHSLSTAAQDIPFRVLCANVQNSTHVPYAQSRIINWLHDPHADTATRSLMQTERTSWPLFVRRVRHPVLFERGAFVFLGNHFQSRRKQWVSRARSKATAP